MSAGKFRALSKRPPAACARRMFYRILSQNDHYEGFCLSSIVTIGRLNMYEDLGNARINVQDRTLHFMRDSMTFSLTGSSPFTTTCRST